jgi:chromosome segregation ATPase
VEDALDFIRRLQEFSSACLARLDEERDRFRASTAVTAASAASAHAWQVARAATAETALTASAARCVELEQATVAARDEVDRLKMQLITMSTDADEATMKLAASKARHHELSVQVIELENRIDHLTAARVDAVERRDAAERSAEETSCLLQEAVARADASDRALLAIQDTLVDYGPSREVNDLNDSLEAIRRDMRDLEVQGLCFNVDTLFTHLG